MEILCIDGKAMRGTVQENGRNPDIVSAYSFSTGLTLATEACQEKSNEIKAIPLLLEKLDIAGKLVTADAMSMQKEIIDIIRARGANLLIELKANQRTLRYGVEDKIKEISPLFSIWKGRRKKRSDKAKGMAELMRRVSMSFTRLVNFLRQK